MPVWPTLFLLNVSTALKGTFLYFLFVVTAAGVVPCVAPYMVHSAVYIFLLVL